MKTCKKCNLEKELTEFGKYKSRGKEVCRLACKACRSKAQSELYGSSEEVRIRMKLTARRNTLLNKYGITEVDYEEMVVKQQGKCAICGLTADKTLNIDHCHDTGKVRGLLCWNCNIGIGYLKHNMENMKNAIKYLGGVAS